MIIEKSILIICGRVMYVIQSRDKKMKGKPENARKLVCLKAKYLPISKAQAYWPQQDMEEGSSQGISVDIESKCGGFPLFTE